MSLKSHWNKHHCLCLIDPVCQPLASLLSHSTTERLEQWNNASLCSAQRTHKGSPGWTSEIKETNFSLPNKGQHLNEWNCSFHLKGRKDWSISEITDDRRNLCSVAEITDVESREKTSNCDTGVFITAGCACTCRLGYTCFALVTNLRQPYLWFVCTLEVTLLCQL